MSRQRLFHFMTLFLALSLLLVACERPIPGSGDGDNVTPETPAAVTPGEEVGSAVTPAVDSQVTAVPATATVASPPPEGEGGDSGAGEEGESTEGEAPPAEPVEETPAEDTPAEEAPAEGGEPGVGGDPGAGDDPDVGGGAPTGETTEGAPPAESGETTTGETAVTTTEGTAATGAATTPTTHTVAAGENLYRIGLRYGVSWITLAQHNNLTNPNRLTVGQVLQIPSATPQPQPTPSPQTETTYTVRRGDTLYRIGLAYGINWIQIAEANGLVNPNQIFPGQVLKIPVNRPGPSPQFTHTVRPGETLFLISLQYGVPWTAIAQANNISSPYVIYVGQTLVIPGN